MSKMLSIICCSKCGVMIDEKLKYRSFPYGDERICANCMKEIKKDDRTRCSTKENE